MCRNAVKADSIQNHGSPKPNHGWKNTRTGSRQKSGRRFIVERRSLACRFYRSLTKHFVSPILVVGALETAYFDILKAQSREADGEAMSQFNFASPPKSHLFLELSNYVYGSHILWLQTIHHNWQSLTPLQVSFMMALSTLQAYPEKHRAERVYLKYRKSLHRLVHDCWTKIRIYLSQCTARDCR